MVGKKNMKTTYSKDKLKFNFFFDPETETSIWLVTQTSQRECRRDCMTSKSRFQRSLVVDYDSAPPTG